ncbi:RNA recognition motif 2-domain-containing protein [Hypoxylon trugodes]|uniref:RNA recognition motif 2-domain-containing protein n=1 Tax=Hypoxylon trugodes TaxID=326681 RepID=UPI0021981B85|nr:RNA recognition motif 2-domain-containing protein [Hypoxylon trugodes]KAI1393851.1 RNA recognition motif 2-domain-containing protein [Hypoxylon trugodes]
MSTSGTNRGFNTGFSFSVLPQMQYNSSDKMSNMQQAREGHFNPVSPHSSSGAADSFKGTPDTRLTTFSPEDGSARSTKTLASLNASARDVGPIKYDMASTKSLERPGVFYRSNLQLEKDPFVTSAGPSYSGRQKLSPTATVFSPLPPAMVARGAASEPKRADAMSERLSQGGGHASRRSSPPASSINAHFIRNQLSTDMGISRCLILSSPIGSNVTADEFEIHLTELLPAGTAIKGSRQVYEFADQVFVRFTDIRDACAVFSNISLGGRNWSVRAVSPREFTSVIDPNACLVTAHEGQLYLSVFSHSANSMTTTQLETFLKDLLQSEGDLFAFKVHEGAPGALISAVIEYCDNGMAIQALSKFNGTIINGLQICMIVHRPDLMTIPTGNEGGAVDPIRTMSTAPADLATSLRQLSLGRQQPAVQSASSLLSTPARPHVPSSNFPLSSPFGMMPLVYPGLPINTPYMIDQAPSRTPSMLSSSNYSLASPSMLQPNSFMSTDLVTPRQFQSLGRPDGRRQNAMRVSRSPYYNVANHHNHVDIGRIRDGIDVRTTIMLRNIPNKVDQALLKRIVDESSWGKYDFMYLRIDFANDCNVGYAFINFVDPLDIIDFVRARGNQRWNCFKSDKVAEISYATIQGKDCLVQKFRNSSVMLEAPHYRPKLFFTLNGPHPGMAGNEEPFPEPDNQSKMKRSCENAEHVGLFTPNAGQHFRDEQRRRRSQFDRGNPRLDQGEYDDHLLPIAYYPQQ